MAVDTYKTIWNGLLLRCPSLGAFRAQQFIQHSFRQIAERRRWSWLVKYNQFHTVPLQQPTVSLTTGSMIVTGIGTNWGPDIVGQQFRIASTTPIYSITQWLGPTTAVLNLPWYEKSYASINAQIYQAYFTPPNDFFSFISVWDTQQNWQLWLDVPQTYINGVDAQRSDIGQSWVVSFREYTQPRAGTLTNPVQIVGSSSVPQLGGDSSYSGTTPGFFLIKIVAGGQVGTATFTWNKNSGTNAPTVSTSTDEQALQDGVFIYWPSGVTFNAGDSYIIQAAPGTQTGIPMYELWPQNQNNPYVYSFLYECRAPDLNDPGATLPAFIRGDVVLEGGLAMTARWPGTETAKNPYFNLQTAITHEARFEKMVMELERQDDEVNEIDVSYPISTMPYAPYPFADSAWLQDHAI